MDNPTIVRKILRSSEFNFLRVCGNFYFSQIKLRSRVPYKENRTFSIKRSKNSKQPYQINYTGYIKTSNYNYQYQYLDLVKIFIFLVIGDIFRYR